MGLAQYHLCGHMTLTPYLVKQGIAAGKTSKREKGGGRAVQGRAAVNGGERGIIGYEVMRLGLGFKKVQ